MHVRLPKFLGQVRVWRSWGRGHRNKKGVYVSCSGSTFCMSWSTNFVSDRFFMMSRWKSNIEVMRSRSRSYERYHSRVVRLRLRSFTPPTGTVLSSPCRRWGRNWLQDKRLLSCFDPVSNFQVFSIAQYIWNWTVANWRLGQDKTKLNLETGSRQNKIVLSCRQFCSHHRQGGQDKTVLFYPCRRCEIGMKVIIFI